jgi:hypothetical protein
MEMLPCLVFPAFAALVVTLIVVGILQAKKRRQEAARLAAEMGVRFFPDDIWGLPKRYGAFDLFGRGHSKKASNILSGDIDGRSTLAFDYQYTTGSGKNQTTHHYQAVVLTLPIRAAKLRLRSENVFDRVASWVGYDDLDFESDEFSRRYHVQCDDRRFAYDIFHARLIDYLLRCGTSPNIEMTGPVLMLYESRGSVRNCRRMLQIGRAIVRSIPDYVLSARGSSATQGGPP